MDIGSIKTVELIHNDNIKVGDKIKDQKKRTWEIVSIVEQGPFDKYKCKLISL